MIFCRNVIIYFDQPTIVGVMERFFESLRPGGWMFLGYSESLFKISTRFEMVEVGGTFAYQRPLSTVRKPPAPVTSVARPSAPPPPARSPTDVESVLRNLKRQEAIEPAPALGARPPPPSAARPPTAQDPGGAAGRGGGRHREGRLPPGAAHACAGWPTTSPTISPRASPWATCTR